MAMTRPLNTTGIMPVGSIHEANGGAGTVLRHTPAGRHPRMLPQRPADGAVEAVRLNPLHAATHPATSTAQRRQPTAATLQAAGTTTVSSLPPSSAVTAAGSSLQCRRPRADVSTTQPGEFSARRPTTSSAGSIDVRLHPPTLVDELTDPHAGAVTQAEGETFWSTSPGETAPSADLIAVAREEPERSPQQSRGMAAVVMPVGPALVLGLTEEAPPSSVPALRTERGTTRRGHGSSIQERSSDDVVHYPSASSDEVDCHPSASFDDVARYLSESGRSSVSIRTDRLDQSSAAHGTHGTTSVTPQNRPNSVAPQHGVNFVSRRPSANHDCFAWMGLAASGSRRRLNHVFGHQVFRCGENTEPTTHTSSATYGGGPF